MNMKQKQQRGNALTLFKHHQLAEIQAWFENDHG